jgi:hypothetical protein
MSAGIRKKELGSERMIGIASVIGGRLVMRLKVTICQIGLRDSPVQKWLEKHGPAQSINSTTDLDNSSQTFEMGFEGVQAVDEILYTRSISTSLIDFLGRTWTLTSIPIRVAIANSTASSIGASLSLSSFLNFPNASP